MALRTNRIQDVDGWGTAYRTTDGRFIVAGHSSTFWSVYRRAEEGEMNFGGPGLPWCNTDVNAHTFEHDGAWWIGAWDSPTKSDALFEIERDCY